MLGSDFRPPNAVSRTCATPKPRGPAPGFVALIAIGVLVGGAGQPVDGHERADVFAASPPREGVQAAFPEERRLHRRRCLVERPRVHPKEPTLHLPRVSGLRRIYGRLLRDELSVEGAARAIYDSPRVRGVEPGTVGLSLSPRERDRVQELEGRLIHLTARRYLAREISIDDAGEEILMWGGLVSEKRGNGIWGIVVSEDDTDDDSTVLREVFAHLGEQAEKRLRKEDEAPAPGAPTD